MTKGALASDSCQPAYPDPLPGIIPFGGITLLAAPPGAGKTALIAGLAQRLRDTLPIFGHQPNQLPEIAVLNADRNWERGNHEWFVRAGFPEIKCYSCWEDEFVNTKTLHRKYDRTRLWADFVDRLKLPAGSLVITDPITPFLGGDLNKYDDCMVACIEIRRLLRQRKLTTTGLGHTGKQKADPRSNYLRSQDRILGSSALLGFTDTQMYLATPEETGLATYTFAWAPHLMPAENFRVVRTSTGLFVPATADNNIERVLELIPLDGTAIGRGEVVQLALAYPLSAKTVDRALVQLREEGRIEKLSHGQFRRSIVN